MIQKYLTEQNLRITAIFLGLFLLTAGASWLLFYFIIKPQPTAKPIDVGDKRAKIDPNAPKTEACPINGKKFSKAEREIWEKRQPLNIMVENHEESRPQSGLTSADVVYEAVAEGGITRFMAVFYCGASAEEVTVGPVRSARIYYVDWASEYGDKPLYVHVGGANRTGPADALGAISKYGWLSDGNDLNQFAVGFPTFWRDYERIGHPVATEHTMYSTTDKLWEVAAERKLDSFSGFTPWNFKDAGSAGQVSSIAFSFWSNQPDYSVKWIFDSAAGVWKRENGGQAQTDLNNQKQVEAANVVVQFVKEQSLKDPEKHMLYSTTGKGDAIIFTNGNVIRGKWEKTDRTSRTKFTDSRGAEINFIPGQIWVEALPLGTSVTY
ncbi:DUF3048 domain-containing protein [Candidatus Microgenomates bacterium]|nr:DUF3048 domain-containing protein [Candidatus Microgenomates bacterium]